MLVSGTRDQRIAAIAGRQRGRLARRQLLAAGVSRNMIHTMLHTGLLVARSIIHRRHRATGRARQPRPTRDAASDKRNESVRQRAPSTKLAWSLEPGATSVPDGGCWPG